jgi:hypothetical protein
MQKIADPRQVAWRDIRSEVFEHPGIVAGRGMKVGQVLAVGRRKAPGRELLYQKAKEIKAEIHAFEKPSHLCDGEVTVPIVAPNLAKALFHLA